MELVRELIASMQKEIDGRVVEVDSEDRQPTVLVDRRLVKLALKQLVDNALKYSPPKAPVQIRISRGEPGINVDVIDHGAGIPALEQVRVFDRFWRSPSVRKQMPGTGLGLSIAKGIARANNGELTFSSSPGGTTFRLTLPPATEEGEGN
jgi:signal transduction histidine kinase